MKKFLFIFILLVFNICFSEDSINCNWNTNIPCLNINYTNNTSNINQDSIIKTVITKSEIKNSGYNDLRSILENVAGLDVYSDGPIGQKTSIFLRGTNSNHTLVLLNGIPINDPASPKGMYDFGYDFLFGLQKIEIYKGANGAIFGPGAIGGAINLITDIDYKNSISISGYDKKNNSLSGNYFYISQNDWQHNFKGGVAQSKELSTQNTFKDIDGAKNFTLNYNLKKILNDNYKFNLTSYIRNTKSDYDSWDDEFAIARNNFYSFQSNLDRRKKNIEDKLTFHLGVHDRYYDTAVKNKYFSKSATLKIERKLDLSNKFSVGFGNDYNYNMGKFQINGDWGSSARGHTDNLGLYGNTGYKFNETSIFNFHVRGDRHKYSKENITYKLGITKNIKKFTFNLSEATGIRTPDLYVLHGVDVSGNFRSMMTTKAESSKIREVSVRYKLSNKIEFNNTVYSGYISDVLNRSTNTGGYNEIIDVTQKGIESNIQIQNNNKRLLLSSTLSKSREGDGRPQQRRPEKQFGVKYSADLGTKLINPFSISVDYKHTGKVEDWKEGTYLAKVDSTDIINFSLSKKILNSVWSINVINFTDEHYQKPDTYNQPGRKIYLNFNSSF